MESSEIADRELIASGFREAMAGKMDDELIESAVASQLAIPSGIRVTGSIESLIFFLAFQIDVVPPFEQKRFSGKGGGLSGLGLGYIDGHLYADDPQRLYQDTVSFMFELSPLYTALQFFDSRSAHLGTVHALAITNLIFGFGGGAGSWT